MRSPDAPRRGTELVGRPGALDVAAIHGVGGPPATRLQLRVLGNLVDALHPAVRRMMVLRLEEQFLDVARRHPIAQHGHEPTDVVATVFGFLVLRVEQVRLRALLDEPYQLIVEGWRRRHHDGAALGGHHHVGVGPVQATAPLQRGSRRVGQPVVIPVPHEHMLKA